MSALTIPQIPTNINTVEKLAVWASKLLSDISPNLQIKTDENVTQRVATWGLYRDFDGGEVVVTTLIIPINSLYATGNLKLWEYANPLANVVLPVGFTSN